MRFLSLLIVVAPVLAATPPAPAEQVLETFPFTVIAGLPPGREPRVEGSVVLRDLPFDAARGHGHVGGLPGLRLDVPAFGGDPSWPLSWREGIEKYVFRVPRGEYLVELSFLETAAAAAGLRVFDVLAEEKELFPRLDIAALAGDFQWLTLAGRVAVYDGWLDLRFVAATGDRAPRVSRIRVDRAGEPVAPPAPLELAARGSLGQILLTWQPPRASGIAGYDVFRAESAAGPFTALTASPTPLSSHADLTAEPDREYRYQVRARSVDGVEGAFTEPRSAAARRPEAAGLRVYDLRLPPGELRRLAVPAGDGVEALGELVVQGQLFHVQVRADTRPEAWHRKKSYWITPQREQNRSVLRRRQLYLSAGAGDPTALRAKVAAEALALAGLSTPAVEPVVLLLNGVYQGLYHDLEALDRRFRSRVRLDRVGLLALETRGETLRADWVPYGEQRGEEGNLMSLTELVHELNRIESGETARFFEERFYLDRLVDRWAVQVLRGSPHRFATGRFLLKDSRNGKWELFEDRPPSGAFGIGDWQVEPRHLTESETLGVLLGGSLEAMVDGGEAHLIETRFLREPQLRERLAARVEELAAGALAPAKIDALVDAAFARIREAALADPWRWPLDDGATLLRGPERIQQGYRSHLETVKRAVASLRSPRSPPLRLNEAAVEAASGEPWIEVASAGPASEDLRGYFLTSSASHAAPAALLPPAKRVEPGGVAVLKLADLRAAAPADGELPFRLPGMSGGILALWRGKPSGPRELCDLVVVGPTIAGGSYGRGSDGGWALLAAATPGAPNGAEMRRAPPYDLRQGVTASKSGDATIWIKVRSSEAPEAARPARVTLHYREATGGDGAFEAVPLEWDATSFQYAITLAAKPERRRTAYYFTVASQDGGERRWPLPAPELTFFLPEPVGVKLNEVLPRPSRAPGSPGEYIEIFNPGTAPVDLEGFFLTDSSRNPTRWRIPAGFPVPAKGFQVFYADGLNRGNHASFKLSNSGEYLGLFGRMEEGNLLVDQLAFRGVRTGESWGATPDGTRSFRSWKDPTPGKRNIPKIPEEYLKKRQAGAGIQPEPPPAPPVEPPVPVEDPEDEDDDE
jgi:hypothetical protein